MKTFEDILNRIREARPGEVRTIVTEEMDSMSKIFIGGSIAALYWSLMSLRFGTAELTYKYFRVCGLYGAIGCGFAVVRDRIRGE